MYKLILVFTFLYSYSPQIFSCEDWFKSLKIKNIKSCISECTTGQTDMSSYFCTNQCDNLCKNLGKKSDTEPNFYDLTDEEVNFCKVNKVTCIKAFSLSWQAEQSCISIYSKSRTNDESDACRHYFWSFFLANEFGEEVATKILNAHENHPKNIPKEKNMDIENNKNAITDYKKNKNADENTIMALFKNRIKSKKMNVLNPRYESSGGLP